jgi:hypothetical protein
MRHFLRFALAGMIVGFLMGWGLSVVSGNTFVILVVGGLGTLVGLVLGVAHSKRG